MLDDSLVKPSCITNTKTYVAGEEATQNVNNSGSLPGVACFNNLVRHDDVQIARIINLFR